MKVPKIKRPFKMTPTRFYNDLQDQGDKLLKSSIYAHKIKAEMRYYEKLEANLLKFHPQFLGKSSQGQWKTGYLIEKIPACDYGQIFSGLCDSPVTYQKVLEGIESYISEVPKKSLEDQQWKEKLERQILERGGRRLASLKAQDYYDEVVKVFVRKGWGGPEAFLEELNRRTRLLVGARPQTITWKSHGDLCFSNIIPHEGRLYLVDPRGHEEKDDGHLVPYYDLAKISQCLCGGYDFINNEVDYSPKLRSSGQEVEAFEAFVQRLGLSYELTRLVEAGHFFSMLPLHISSPRKVLAFAEKSIQVLELMK